MNLDPNHLAEQYGRMSENELMALAREYDELADAAQTALRAEFARRGLEPPLVEDVAIVEQRKLVTVNRYRDLSEAIVARSMLESAGIAAYLPDENVLRMDWAWSNMMGGLRLQVGEGDEAEAKAILNEHVPAEFALDDGTEFEQPKCPVCGSTEITFQGADRGPAIVALFGAGVPLPLGDKTWACDACGTRWEETEDAG